MNLPRPRRITDRPNNDQKCANDRCGHRFGLHYTTLDGKHRGCGYRSEDFQREPSQGCACTAFLIQFEYPKKQGERP